MSGPLYSYPVHPAALRTFELVRSESCNGFGFTLSGQQPCLLSGVVPGSKAEIAGLRPGQVRIWKGNLPYFQRRLIFYDFRVNQKKAKLSSKWSFISFRLLLQSTVSTWLAWTTIRSSKWSQQSKSKTDWAWRWRKIRLKCIESSL